MNETNENKIETADEGKASENLSKSGSTKKNCSNKNKRNSGRRNNNRNKRNEARNPDKIKPTNTAAMYFSNLELAEQAAQFSFSNYLGQPQLSAAYGSDEIPTVLSIALNPSPGVTNGDLTSGINIMGLRTYTRLSAGNAKTTNYAPQDVSTLILAIGEVISMIEVAKRAMRVAYTFNMRNRALPLGIIRAMGIDPSFIKTGQIAQMRMKLNYVINSFNQVPILANVTYFQKCAEVYANYYSDSKSMMAQYFLFAPFSTWTINESLIDKGTVLTSTAVCLGHHNRIQTMDDLLDTIQNMINKILESSTFNYIFSDILRLCGPSDLLTVPLLPEGEAILPVFDPMKLLQIHNAVAVGSPIATVYEEGISTPSNDVYPNVDKNGLEYYPQLTGTGLNDFIIDFPNSEGKPDLDQRVDATRYLGFVNRDSEGKVDFLNSTLPDHYIVDFDLFYDEDIMKAFQSYNSLNSAKGTGVSDMLYVSSSIGKYDYHPIIHYRDETTGKTYSFGDVDFFTTIDIKYLQRINDLAFQGLFEFRTNKF